MISRLSTILRRGRCGQARGIKDEVRLFIILGSLPKASKRPHKPESAEESPAEQ